MVFQIFHLFLFLLQQWHINWLIIIFFCVLSSILQIKSDRSVEIKLNCSTLMFSLKSISEDYINFGSIESSVSLIDLKSFAYTCNSLGKLIFSVIPHFMSS